MSEESKTPRITLDRYSMVYFEATKQAGVGLDPNGKLCLYAEAQHLETLCEALRARNDDIETALAEKTRELEEIREDIFWATSGEPCHQNGTPEGQKVLKLATDLFESENRASKYKAVAERLAAYVRDVRVSHSGACLDFSRDPWGVTEESCECSPAKRNAIAALSDFEELGKGEEP